MPSRLFAYNAGAAISGASQSGNLAVSNNSAGGGSVTWWNGPDESPGYVIGYPDTSGNRTSNTIPVVGNAVGFRRTLTKSDADFVTLVTDVSGQVFASASLAAEWLNTNGYYTSYPTGPSIITTGLKVNLQTAPSSGTTWTDATGNGYNATLNGGSIAYVSSNSGGIILKNANSAGTDYISVPYNIAGNTATIEIVASFNPTSFWGTIWGNEVYNTGAGFYAYLSSSTFLVWGKPTGGTSKTITASNSIRHWVFIINNTSLSIYINGVILGTVDTITAQTLFATNNLYFGSRHTNAGTGATDKLNNSSAANYPVFYQMRIYDIAFSASDVSNNFNAIRGTYGL